MLRISLLLAGLSLLAAGPASAQPANATPVTAMPTPPVLLADIYVARATIAHCDLTIDPMIVSRMSEHETNLELQLGMDPDAAKRGFDEISDVIVGSSSACTEGSEALKTLGRVSERYSQAPQ